MFSEVLQELRQTVRTLDPATLSGPQAVALMDTFTEIERLVLAARTLVAARAVDTNQWRSDGDRSPEHWLARRTGSSWSEARSTLETAARLKKLPATENTLRSGKLSATQAVVVSEAATADPHAEQELLAGAGRESVAELRRRAERVMAAKRSVMDERARADAIRRSRSTRKIDCADGSGEIRAHGPRADIAKIWARLQPFIDAEFAAARKQRRVEPVDAYAFDALKTMSETGGSSKSPVKVIVRVDLAAIRRGTTEPGEVCEIAGCGPIPVSEALRLMPEAFLALVVTKGRQVINVTHLGRKFTEFQTTAMEWQDPECAVLGCSATARLQRDHRADWAKTRKTTLNEADRLCGHHHDLKTRLGYLLEPGTGKRKLLPPQRAPSLVSRAS